MRVHVARWLKGSLLVLALAAVGTGAASKVAQHRSRQLERARRALDAVELPRAAALGFALPQHGGGTLDLRQLKGKVVLVTFWATWCPPCRDEEPSLRELTKRLSRDSFQLIAVSADEGWEPVDRFFAGDKPPYPVVLDRGGVVSRTWGTTMFPESYVVDASGDLRLKFVGPRDWTDLRVLTVLRSLGARRAP